LIIPTISPEETSTMNRKRLFSAMVLGALALSAVEVEANEALVKARQKFFGIENVDVNGNVKGDKVIASWASNTARQLHQICRIADHTGRYSRH
jgi:hypothetical protein